MNMDLDVCDVLPSIRVPTLVVSRTNVRLAGIRTARYLADHIPGARLVELPGDDIAPALGDPDQVLAELDTFLAEVAEGKQWDVEPDRVLATVLVTDLVASTAKAVELGPRWRELLRDHNAVIRQKLAEYRGREIDTAGDGFFASGFDGPARAIRCACAIRGRSRFSRPPNSRRRPYRRVRDRGRQTLRSCRRDRLPDRGPSR
jgi:class 3 adenylate cyclase